MRATFDDTFALIKDCGFIYGGVEDGFYKNHFFSSPGEDAVGTFDVVIYLSKAGHYCVSIDGGFCAPIVWDGERLPEFVAWLDEHHAGWRG